jgi:hypothetical protein
MTEERSNLDIDGVSDPLVSRTYRESATERAPNALNQAVLRQAAQNASNRYSRSVIWMRPMAWAATIGLCLAIVIELANLPQPDPAMRVAPAEEAQLDSIDTIAPQRTEAEPLEQRARKTIDDQGRVKLLNAPALGKSEAPKSQLEIAPEPALSQGLTSDTDLFQLQDSPLLEEAEELARSRENKDTESDAGALSFAASPTAAAKMPMPCRPEIRVAPESWLECIVELEDTGLDELASQQRELLQEAFPDFEFP